MASTSIQQPQSPQNNPKPPPNNAGSDPWTSISHRQARGPKYSFIKGREKDHQTRGKRKLYYLSHVRDREWRCRRDRWRRWGQTDEPPSVTCHACRSILRPIYRRPPDIVYKTHKTTGHRSWHPLHLLSLPRVHRSIRLDSFLLSGKKRNTITFHRRLTSPGPPLLLPQRDIRDDYGCQNNPLFPPKSCCNRFPYKQTSQYTA